MPTNIKVVYWNVEDFGDGKSGRRGNYVPLCNFIAQVVKNLDADILCLMEMRATAVGPVLDQLLLSLLNAHIVIPPVGPPVQTCDWYCDWVAGALRYHAFGPPYSPNNVGFTGQARNEGYAVFWKSNIAKFLMQRADIINLPDASPPAHAVIGMVPNTQSGGVRARNDPAGAGGVAGVMVAALPNDIDTAMGQYTLPQNSNVAAGGIMRPGVGVVVPAGVTAAPQQLNPGDLISANTQISLAGIRLNNPALGVQPIVVPGRYRLTAALRLPPNNAPLLSMHSLGLVLSCRQNPNYLAGGGNLWQLGTFPGAAGANLWNGSRRPAYCTIKITTPPPAPPPGQVLIPITFYHAPVGNPVNAMQDCAIAKSLYEAQGPIAYLPNDRSIVGGDFNARLNAGAAHYTVYTNDFANGGAGCNDAGNQNIRVNAGVPVPAPNFPPLGGAGATPANNPVNKSSVQLRYPVVGGQRVLSNNVDHYRGDAIDNIFYRGFTPLQAPRNVFRVTPPGLGVQQQFTADLYDLVRAVSGAVPAGLGAIGAAGPDNFFIPPAIISAFGGLPVFGLLAILAAPPAGLNAVLSPHRLLADINAGIFQTPVGVIDPLAPGGAYVPPPPVPTRVTAQRRAAEFIRLFVSDHLPVIFGMAI